MKRQIEIPVNNNPIRTFRSLDVNHPDNRSLFNKENELEFKELLDEVKIRFDTNPKYYQREDFWKLISLFKYQDLGRIIEEYFYALEQKMLDLLQQFDSIKLTSVTVPGGSVNSDGYIACYGSINNLRYILTNFTLNNKVIFF